MSVPNVDALLELLGRGSHADDGEGVDLLHHMLQCATLLAEQAPDDPELHVAGLVHDLGTVLRSDAPATHATTGAAAIECLLGDRVASLVAGHDQAKRYLVSSDVDYRGRLSDMSVATLALQGGDMDDAECARFEADEHFDALVALRRADDAAKVSGQVVPGLDEWRPSLEAVAARQSRSKR